MHEEKFVLILKLIEDENGLSNIKYDIKEKGITMKELAFVLYHIKRIEQEIIDRDWDYEEGFDVRGDEPDGR